MKNTKTLFGHTFTTSVKGRITRPSLVKALRDPAFAKRIRVVLTSHFDGMIDGSRSCEVETSASVLAGFVESGRSTFGLYVNSNGTLHVYDACRSYDVSDRAEDDRRAAMVAELPSLSGELLTNGHYTMDSGKRATESRANHLANLSGIAFDEAVEALRTVSDPLVVITMTGYFKAEDWSPAYRAA